MPDALLTAMHDSLYQAALRQLHADRQLAMSTPARPPRLVRSELAIAQTEQADLLRATLRERNALRALLETTRDQITEVLATVGDF